MKNIGLANVSVAGVGGSMQDLAVDVNLHMQGEDNCNTLSEDVTGACTDAVGAVHPGDRDQQVCLLTAALKSNILRDMAKKGELKVPKRQGEKFRYALGALTLILAATKVKDLTDFDGGNIEAWIIANFSD